MWGRGFRPAAGLPPGVSGRARMCAIFARVRPPGLRYFFLGARDPRARHQTPHPSHFPIGKSGKERSRRRSDCIQTWHRQHFCRRPEALTPIQMGIPAAIPIATAQITELKSPIQLQRTKVSLPQL